MKKNRYIIEFYQNVYFKKYLSLLLSILLILLTISGCGGKKKALAQAHLERGIEYLNAGNRDDAWDDFDEAIELNPKLEVTIAQLFLERGIEYLNAGNRLEAGDEFDEAIELNPKLEVTIAQLFLERGKKVLETPDGQDPILYFSEAIDLDPELVEAYLLRGICWLNNSLGNQAALSDFETVFKLAPDTPNINNLIEIAKREWKFFDRETKQWILNSSIKTLLTDSSNEFAFVSEVRGLVTVETLGNLDTYLTVAEFIDGRFVIIGADNDSGYGNNARYVLKADLNKWYYFFVRGNNKNVSGTYEIHVSFEKDK